MYTVCMQYMQTSSNHTHTKAVTKRLGTTFWSSSNHMLFICRCPKPPSKKILRNMHFFELLHSTNTLRSPRVYDDEILPWIQPHEEIKTQNYTPPLTCHCFLTSTILPCLPKNLHPIFFQHQKKSEHVRTTTYCRPANSGCNDRNTWHPRPPATALSAFGSTERCPHVPATYRGHERLAKSLPCFTMVYPVFP